MDSEKDTSLQELLSTGTNVIKPRMRHESSEWVVDDGCIHCRYDT